MKELDSALGDDSVSLADVARNATTDQRRSVQSKSYDVMYCTTTSHHSEGTTYLLTSNFVLHVIKCVYV